MRCQERMLLQLMCLDDVLIISDHSVSYSNINETPAGVKQTIASGENGRLTQEIVDKANTYVEEVVLKDSSYAKVRKDCKNRHPECAYWAALGECEANVSIELLQSCGVWRAYGSYLRQMTVRGSYRRMTESILCVARITISASPYQGEHDCMLEHAG